MTRRLKKLIKEFVFEEKNRSRIVLGTGVRLSPEDQRLELAPLGGPYSLAPDQFATTWVTNPNRLKQWLLFEAIVKNKKDSHGAVMTSVGYRLSLDGTAHLWWNGSIWTAPSAGQWNTEAEISAHLPTFPVATQSLAVVVNLVTTNPLVTPTVKRLKFLYSSDLEFQEEYVARSLVPLMREELLPISDYAFKATAGQTTATLKAIETKYNVVSIDAVYNNASDPNQVNDLYASYDPTTKTVTWTGPAAAGDVIWIRFVYSLEIIMAQSQDFTELSKVPAVLIESVDSGEKFEIGHTDWVVDKATNAGWRLAPGFQCDLDVSIRFTADKLKDLDRMSDQAKKVFTERLFRARGQDELFRLYVTSEYTQAFSETQSELHSGRLRARICRAVFYPNDAKPVNGVQRFLMNGKVISEA
jgi:hypothetical protein